MKRMLFIIAMAITVMIISSCKDKSRLTDDESVALEVEILRTVSDLQTLKIDRTEEKDGKLVVTLKGSKQNQDTLGTHLKLLSPAEYEVTLLYPKSDTGKILQSPSQEMSFRFTTPDVNVEVINSFTVKDPVKDKELRVLPAGTILKSEPNGVWRVHIPK